MKNKAHWFFCLCPAFTSGGDTFTLEKKEVTCPKCLAYLVEAAEQKMHPTLGESVASDSESNPAPKRVI